MPPALKAARCRSAPLPSRTIRLMPSSSGSAPRRSGPAPPPRPRAAGAASRSSRSRHRGRRGPPGSSTSGAPARERGPRPAPPRPGSRSRARARRWRPPTRGSVWTSTSRSSTVPSRGCGRASHHTIVWSVGPPPARTASRQSRYSSHDSQRRRDAAARVRPDHRGARAGHAGVAAEPERRVGAQPVEQRQPLANAVHGRHRRVGVRHAHVHVKSALGRALDQALHLPLDALVALRSTSSTSNSARVRVKPGGHQRGARIDRGRAAPPRADATASDTDPHGLRAHLDLGQEGLVVHALPRHPVFGTIRSATWASCERLAHRRAAAPPPGRP